ncbi:MAG: error-prone DNA polymerase [Byssovorax sp.]
MDTPFAELLGRSSYSFLEGASHPGELVHAAKALSLTAFALCDRDGLYGSVKAHVAAKEHGQRVIVGAELTLDPDEHGRPRPASSVALLAQDLAGYGNLCTLLTIAHADHDKGSAGISPEEIARYGAGLVAIVPLDESPRLRAGSDALFDPLIQAFGDRLFAATYRHGDGRDGARTATAIEVEDRYALPILATSRALYHAPVRKPLADVLHCIRRGITLDEAGTAIGPNDAAHLRSGDMMRRLFPDQPAWIERTVEVAGACRFSLDELRYSFPSDTLCMPGESADRALQRAVGEGCMRRYPDGVPAKVAAQIDKELAIIARLDVAPYFLSVQQVVEMARAKKILCQGRGSAANSAVCYVLGVTAVDPSQSDLLFERFLSEERREPPDIDVDFEHERREEIIQEIYTTYGRDRAAMVSEVISYRGKSAMREVGKVFGLSLDQVDRLAGLVIHMDKKHLAEERIREVGLDPEDARLRMVLDLSREIQGFPRHLSIHVGGFVLSSVPLSAVAPIEKATMPGRTVIPWDKDDLDDLRFFKLDVLGLGMLTAIRKALAMIHEGPEERFDPIEALAGIPREDPRVYEAIQRADTIGVFQIESRAQMSMLPRLRPEKFYDLVVEVAIVRPGPIQGGMVHPYLRRRMGQEPPTAPHPILEPILRRTLGVPLFQEQVMQIAMTGAGYTAGEADQLRRDMASWRKNGRLERHRPRLLEGFARHGISERFAEQLYKQVQGFGEYGFPESHASSFALLVYDSAWLKVHHPEAFVCALLNAQPMGFYSASSLVKDAQRHGVAVRPVSITESRWDSTLEPPDAGSASRRRALRLGFRLIKGLGESTGRDIEKARDEAPFTSLEDLILRASLKKSEIEALAEAGALAPLVPERRNALWRARAPREDGLYEGLAIEGEGDIGLRPMPALQQLALDYGRVGLSLHDHPMKHLRDELRQRGVRRAEELAKLRDGCTVRVAGLVIGRQRPGTAQGITFFTLEDETGMVNLIVQAKLFGDNYAVARHAQLLLVKGRLERQGSVIHVLALSLTRLDLPGGAEIASTSRDFH